MKDQHTHFSEAYAAGASGKDAAIKAGYSPGRAKQTASELLRRPDVSSHIAELQEARAADLDIDARALVIQALKYHEMALRGDAPAGVGVRALDLIGKILGAYTTRHEVESRTVHVVMNLQPREEVA